MIRIALLLAAAAPGLAALPSPAAAYQAVAVLEGPARVIDGDGLRIGRQEVRLQGIAAPEWDERGGAQATAALRSMAEGRHVVCHLDGTTTYDRVVGRCAVDGQDVGAALVVGGFALDCPRYSRGDYARHEAAARAAGRDLASVYRRPGYCRR